MTETLCTVITSFSPVSCAAVSPSLRSLTGTTNPPDLLAQWVWHKFAHWLLIPPMVSHCHFSSRSIVCHTELEKDRKSSFFYRPFFFIDQPKISEQAYFFLCDFGAFCNTFFKFLEKIIK